LCKAFIDWLQAAGKICTRAVSKLAPLLLGVKIKRLLPDRVQIARLGAVDLEISATLIKCALFDWAK
jgi:hypothetical protein